MTDLQELFNRDPLHLTDPDLDDIIAQLRSLRHHFNASGVAAKDPARAKTPKKPALDVEFEL